MTWDGKLIPNGMYNFFASLTDYPTEELQDWLLDYVSDNKETIDLAVRIILNQRGSGDWE